MTFQQLLTRPLTFLDGGTGTMLQARGLKTGERTETWTIERPEELIRLHKSYIEAGADLIHTNTFGVNMFRYPDDSGYTLTGLVEKAVANAREAISQSAAGRKVFAALDMGPSGELMEPFGRLTYKDAFENFRRLAIAGEKAGADCISIETMFSCEEAKAALEACRTYTSLPVIVSFSFQENGRLLTGETVADAAKTAEHSGVSAVGFNCGFGPVQMIPLIQELTQSVSLPVIAKPNAGLPETVNGKIRYTMESEEFTAAMKDIVNIGARLIGGCCGTTPDFIRSIHHSLKSAR